MKRTLSIFAVLVLCVTLLFTGCSNKEIATKNDKELNETIVLTVGDIKYTQADYNFIYKLLYDNMSQYAMYYGEDWINFEIEEGKTIGDFIKENTVNQLKQLAAANTMAAEKDIKVDRDIKKSVEQQKKDIIENNYGGEKEYVAFLEDARTTDKAINTYLQMYEVYNKLYEEMSSKGGDAYIEDKDVEAAFLEEYSDKLRVQHILISTQEQTDENGNTTPARSDEDAQALVKEVLGKLEAGEDFDALIAKYDEDPGMESGKFYVFGEGEMVSEFEEASKNLEIGKYTTEAVKTSYGYHIIKRYDITTEMDEFNGYKDTKMQEKAAELINKKLDSLTVKSEDKIIDEYVAAWQADMKKAEEAAQSAPEAEAESATEGEAAENETATEGEANAENSEEAAAETEEKKAE